MQGDYNNRWFIGQPVQLNWDLETIGVWQLGEEEKAKEYGQKPGQFKVRDYNDDGVIMIKIVLLMVPVYLIGQGV